MSLADRHRIGVSCIASVSVHAVALGAATYFAAPQMLWQTDVVRGRAGSFVLSLAAAASTPATPMPLEIEPIESEPLETEPVEIEPVDSEPEDTPQRPAHSEVDVVAAVEATQPTQESLRPTPVALTRQRIADDAQPEALVPVVRPRPKLPRPQAMTAVGAALSTASPAPIVAPAGADFDVPPQKRPENKPPEFPVQARLDRHEGRVSLVVRVDADGGVSQVTVDTSSGHRILDDAAVRAVREWRFEPALLDGVAVPAEIVVPIRFTLSNS